MEPVIRWRFVASKAYFWGKKIMKPGQIFSAPESAIPAGLRAMIVPLDQISDIPEKEEVPIIPSTVDLSSDSAPIVYRIKERKDTYVALDSDGRKVAEHFYCNIVDSNGKVVNEKPLKKEEAKAMLKKLK
jgi:hypothetical protein